MDYTEKLKELREIHNCTQQEIANQLNINRSTYKDYEIQTSIIPIKHLILLSNIYNVSIDFILGNTGLLTYKDLSRENNSTLIGKRLKEFRKENKLTQVKLASLLNVSQSTIAEYERGTNLIATPFLYEICKRYKISADYLLGRIDEPKYLK